MKSRLSLALAVSFCNPSTCEAKVRLKAHTSPYLTLCLLPVDKDEKVSAPAPASCLSASHCGDHGLTLWNSKQAPQLKELNSFVRVALVMVSSHSYVTATKTTGLWCSLWFKQEMSLHFKGLVPSWWNYLGRWRNFSSWGPHSGRNRLPRACLCLCSLPM